MMGKPAQIKGRKVLAKVSQDLRLNFGALVEGESNLREELHRNRMKMNSIKLCKVKRITHQMTVF